MAPDGSCIRFVPYLLGSPLGSLPPPLPMHTATLHRLNLGRGQLCLQCRLRVDELSLRRQQAGVGALLGRDLILCEQIIGNLRL